MLAAPDTITGWHAHIYYDPASRPAAERLREAIAQAYPEAVLGRWHDVPVGPHSRAMYQVAFPPALFPTLAPFLALNREGLSILLHPETGRQRLDHEQHALWMGDRLALDTATLPD
ncbi:DOPA 4,5-dioxygenase family protein [Roseomonas sp. HJA6]|uniref:DOPA 4,5-dioxygenase family protein n=1 Tax=Roseomonas alba TaxID=2846776 RepID=A0ABS7A3Q3_9PROT|nr:DOPA 4,5-dioxygenase family protein [Neoroseomonas alba]MBW6396928.1 DOPA 4,5-dioxygenase family protein [Neoroseomonas alba]